MKDNELDDLRAQVATQAEQLRLQQGRIEQLEVRLAAVASRGQQPAAAQPKAPEVTEPAAPQNLQTVKLQPPASPRPRRSNPVERAPRLPNGVELKEPDASALQELAESAPGVDSRVREVVDADHAFAAAVKRLNDGELKGAEGELLAFAARWPRHNAADNALYLAGLSRAAGGDCPGALALFDRVPKEYPAGDAVAPALLERARCLTALKRPEAATAIKKLQTDFPDSPEAQASRQLKPQAP